MFDLKISPKKSAPASPRQTAENPPQELTMAAEAENPFPPHPVPESAQSSGTSSPPTDAPTHFDDLIEGAESAERAAAAQERVEVASARLRQEDFRVLFVKGLSGVGMLTGIQSLRLPNGYVDIAAADDCADALYGTILDVPALHFLLSPGNKWLERAFVVGMFSMGMVRAMEAEGREKLAAKRTAQTMDFSKAKAATTAAREKEAAARVEGMPDDEQRSALVGV